MKPGTRTPWAERVRRWRTSGLSAQVQAVQEATDRSGGAAGETTFSSPPCTTRARVCRRWSGCERRTSLSDRPRRCTSEGKDARSVAFRSGSLRRACRRGGSLTRDQPTGRFSQNGGDANATFVSLIASCQLPGIDPAEYLRDLLCLLPSWKAADVLHLGAGAVAEDDSPRGRPSEPREQRLPPRVARRSRPRFLALVASSRVVMPAGPRALLRPRRRRERDSPDTYDHPRRSIGPGRSCQCGQASRSSRGAARHSTSRLRGYRQRTFD
jgi:hypothetical protein